MGTLGIRKLAEMIGLVLAWLLLLLLHSWVTLAIYFANYHHPLSRMLFPLGYVLVLISLVIFVRGNVRRLAAVAVLFTVAAIWWLSIQPTGRGDYLPPVAVQAYRASRIADSR
jgi:hypothetical protein